VGLRLAAPLGDPAPDAVLQGHSGCQLQSCKFALLWPDVVKRHAAAPCLLSGNT